MNPLRRYPALFFVKTFGPQPKTCATIVSALCQAARALGFAIAGQPSCLPRCGSAPP